MSKLPYPSDSRNLEKIFSSLQMMKPSIKLKKQADCKFTLRSINKSTNLNKSFHSTFNNGKSTRKSCMMKGKTKEAKLNSQDTFLSLLSSTGNLFSFAKDVDQGHIRSQFVGMPTRSQGTTNAATLRGTISPQSTNFVSSSKIHQTNKKVVTDYNNSWEEAFNATTHSKA